MDEDSGSERLCGLVNGNFMFVCAKLLQSCPTLPDRVNNTVSNQSILKEISPEYSLEGLILRLKLQYFGHLMERADSFEKTLRLGKIEGGRRKG